MAAASLGEPSKKRQRYLALAMACRDKGGHREHCPPVQPFQRELRYDNVRSAVAEEGLLRMLFREPALLAQTEGLTAEDFSVPLFGRVYAALRERWQNDLAITPAALADSLSPAEMAHLTAVLQKQEPPLSETALADYLRILREERAKARVSDASDLLAMQRDLKKKKGYGGS